MGECWLFWLHSSFSLTCTVVLFVVCAGHDAVVALVVWRHWDLFGRSPIVDPSELSSSQVVRICDRSSLLLGFGALVRGAIVIKFSTNNLYLADSFSISMYDKEIFGKILPIAPNLGRYVEIFHPLNVRPTHR